MCPVAPHIYTSTKQSQHQLHKRRPAPALCFKGLEADHAVGSVSDFSGAKRSAASQRNSCQRGSDSCHETRRRPRSHQGPFLSSISFGPAKEMDRPPAQGEHPLGILVLYRRPQADLLHSVFLMERWYPKPKATGPYCETTTRLLPVNRGVQMTL